LARAYKIILEADLVGVSPALVAIVVFWLAATFASYALYRRSEVTLAGQLLGALVAAGALFLTIELATPLRGALQVSQEPLQWALEIMDSPPK